MRTDVENQNVQLEQIENVSPQVPSLETECDKQEVVEPEVLKPSDNKDYSNAEDTNYTEEQKPVFEVAITRPEKKEHVKTDLSAMKQKYNENTFDSKARSYTVDTGIPEVSFKMTEGVSKTTDAVPLYQLCFNFNLNYPVKMMVPKPNPIVIPKENTPIVINAEESTSEEQSKTEMEEITTMEKFEFLIAEESLFLRDGAISFDNSTFSKINKSIEKILLEYIPAKTREEMVEEIGMGEVSLDDSSYAEWQKKFETLGNKYHKERMKVLENKIKELFIGLCKQHSNDKNHIASLKSSIEAANDYLKAKHELNNTFMGIDLPTGFYREGQFLKKTGSKRYKKDGTENEEETKDKHLGNITILTEIAHNDEDIDVVKLVTQTSKGLTEMWVPEFDLKNRAGIMGISKKGASFNETNIKDIIAYFVALLEDDAKKHQIKHTYMTYSNGWKDNYRTFVCGNTTITSEKDGDKFRHYEFGDKRIASNLEPSGDIGTWVEAINYMGIYELVQVKFCAAYASPLIEYLGIESFIFNSRMKSGKGKTFSDTIVNTGVCNPNGDKRKSLVVNGYATRVGLEQWFVAFNCLPYYIDEASLIEALGKGKKDFVSTIVYLFVSGLDKLRGNVDGKNREQNIFHGVLRMNGENDLSGDDANTGEKARVVNCSMRLPYDEESERRAKAYKEIMTLYKPYGRFFPLYMKKVMEDGREAAIKRFLEYKEYFTVEGVDGNAQRMAQDFAVLALAGYYVNEVFKDIGVQTFDYMKVIKELADSHMSEATTEEQDITALRKFIAWFGGNHKRYNEPEDIAYTIDGKTEFREDKRDYYGFHRNGEIQTFKESFFKIMDTLGYDNAKTGSILRYWNDRGLLIPNPSGATVGKVKVKGVSVPTVRIKEDVADKLLNPEDEEEPQEPNNDILAKAAKAKMINEAYKVQYYREFSGDMDILVGCPSCVVEYVESHESHFKEWKLVKQMEELGVQL